MVFVSLHVIACMCVLVGYMLSVTSVTVSPSPHSHGSSTHSRRLQSNFSQPYDLLEEFSFALRQWCDDTKAMYGIIPGYSWGRMPKGDARTEFRSKRCGAYFSAKEIASRPVSSCHALNYEAPAPLIAIMAGSTTRGMKNISLKSLAIFTLLFPSLIRSLDCGYQYVFVLGYDVGDPLYDSSEGMSQVLSWFNEHVEGVLKHNGIRMSFRAVRVDNILKKPGPVFLEMARTAYSMGADFLYRVNDDIEFRNNWPRAFTEALMSLPKPYGVVGPYVVGKSNIILTVDFVHRLHMEIFDMYYYPPELTDWWMDDWITSVYGKQRTFRSMGVKVAHHTTAHGQRYEVRSRSDGNRLLVKALTDGVNKIRSWMIRNGSTVETIQAFDSDIHRPYVGKKLRDIPNS